MVCVASPAVAQSENENIRPKRNSVYSRFGLGDPVQQYLVAQAGMGGLSATYNDPSHVNMRNPASLAFLNLTSFEVGFNARYANLSSGDESTGLWSGNLDYLALAFPLSNPINEALDRRRSLREWGMSFALQPYTVVGYDVLASTFGPDLGTTTTSFKGNGGTYRVTWGNAYRLNNFAAGVNISYLFGKLTNSRRVFFEDFAVSYDTEILDEISISGFLWEAGLQYEIHFKEPNERGENVPSGKQLVFGVFGHTPNRFNTNYSTFVSRQSGFARDTIRYQEGVRQKGTLPTELTGGIAYENLNKLRVGVEVSRGLWSQYVNEAKPEELQDNFGVAFGVEYIPDIASFNSYLKKVRYRFGGFYRSDPRSFEGKQLEGYALTLGLGFPMIRPRETTSYINFSLEVGQFGHAEVLRETYVRMALGFTLNDNTWFFKRKFN